MAPKPQVKDDPNTFIPPAVRRAAQAADAAFRAQPGQPPQEASPGAAPPEPPPEAPQAAPPVAAPSFEPPPPPVTQQVTPPQPAPPAEEETWERRYNAILTRYRRAEGDIKGMSDQIANMQSLIATMQRPAANETPAELRPQSLLTPEEVTEYGSEFLTVVAKKAKEELSPEVTALKAQLARLESQFQGNAEQHNAKARYDLESTLTQRIPQWRDINVMPEFHAWLALPDMYSGAIRHELLKTAYAQNNTPRVLAFFKGFLDQEAAFVPQGGETHPPDVLQNDERVSLESFAAPGRAKTSAAGSAPVEKPIITRAQISAFYAESAAGKYRGREAEKEQLEKMIFEAERERRIR